jgi:hypothetical protein
MIGKRLMRMTQWSVAVDVPAQPMTRPAVRVGLPPSRTRGEEAEAARQEAVSRRAQAHMEDQRSLSLNASRRAGASLAKPATSGRLLA